MCMTLWKNQNYKDNKQINGCQEEVVGGYIDWEGPSDYFSTVKLFCMIP